MIRARGLLAAGAALALSACAFGPQLHRVAVDHNQMVARSTDELTLLNIVRARYRFPLHFTAISEVNGNVTVGASSSLGVDLDPVVDPASASVGGNVSTSPNFRAAVLATEKFQRGIQAPLGPELIAYYLDEGWRDGLLMALAVERVEAFAAPGDAAPAFTIVNEAEAESDFARLLCTHDLVSVPGAAARPLARLDDVLDVAELGGTGGTPESRRGQLLQLSEILAAERVRVSGERLVLGGASTNTVRLQPRERPRCAGATHDPRLAGMSLRPRLRSTMGVIFFLGEYQRIQAELGAEGAYQIPHCDFNCRAGRGEPERRPLIDVREGDGGALVAARFEGQRYFVPQAELRETASNARTMQVLAFVEQLVNLQKSADQLPSSLSVTRIN